MQAGFYMIEFNYLNKERPHAPNLTGRLPP